MLRHAKRPVVLLIAAVVVALLIISAAIAAPRSRMGQGQGPNFNCPPAAGMQGKAMRPGRMGQGRIAAPQRIADALNLTTEQRERVQNIYQEHRQQVQQMWQSNLSAEEKQIRHQEMRQQMWQRVQDVLTPAQREQAATMWQQGINTMRQRAYGQPGAGTLRQGQPGAQMLRQRAQLCFEQLNLTENQKAQINAIREQTGQAVREVKLNPDLSDQAKIDKITELRAQSHEQVLSVLTPEQREQLNSMCLKVGPNQGEVQGKTKIR